MINCSLQNDPPFLLRRLVDFIFKRRALDFDMHYWTTGPVKCVYQTMLFFALQLCSLLLQIKKSPAVLLTVLQEDQMFLTLSLSITATQPLKEISKRLKISTSHPHII